MTEFAQSSQPAPAYSRPSLVRSRLITPSPAGLLHRSRITERFAQGLCCKLTLVSAPAGYGKTSALVDFAQHTPTPVCWYTADERDRDLATFIEYLTASIRERIPGFGDRTRAALDERGGELLRDPTAVIADLVNEVLDVGDHFVIVIDDYQALEGAFGIRAFLHRLLEVLPSNCHLMLGSRGLPDVPITSLVAKRQLTGLTAHDLRFDAHEVHDLLQIAHVTVSKAQAEAIAANSEGWITGILLLAGILRGETPAALFNEGRANTETYAYLAREVLNRQPPDIQDWLRRSSVLQEMSIRLCQAMLETGSARALLDEIERRNLFVTRFGRGTAATFRYHNLFRDFLHEQLRASSPADYETLHRRAAEYFETAGDVEESVYHHLAAGDYPAATRLVERVVIEWFTRGQVETLLHWAERLPDPVRPLAPRLSLYRGKVLTDRYDYEQARQALAHAEAGFTARADVVHLVKVYNQRALLELFGGHHEAAITQAQAALDLLDREQVSERASAQRLIGRAQVGLGHLDEGIDRLREALALYRQISSLYDVSNLLRDLAYPLTAQGRFEEAITYLNEALVIGRRLDAPTPLAGVLNELGWVRYLFGRYSEAMALYDEGLAAARRGGDLRMQAYISAGMGDIYRDTGDYERAARLYSSAWQMARDSEPSLVVYVLAAQADMYRWQGEPERSLSLLRHAHEIVGQKQLDFERYSLLPLAKGIVLAEGGKVQAGLELLTGAVRFLARRQQTRELARARFLLAKATLLSGDRDGALTELRRSLDLADEIGVDQFAVVEGQHAQELLQMGMAAGITACRTVAERARRLSALAPDPTRFRSETEPVVVDRLEIYALGKGQVVRDGVAVPSGAWQGALVKELFFYILLHGPLERDAIGLVFWPDLSTRRMTDSFHTTLYRLRRAVGADVVIVEEGRYRIGDVERWFDVQEFEALIERAQLLPPQDWHTEDLWRRAITLYRGDFLPEVDRGWCVPKREALRELYVEALIGVARCNDLRGDFETAVEWYRRALEVDDLREDIHRHVIRCYAENGRRSEALVAYQRCRTILERELGVAPSAETQALYKRVVRENAA